jgi:hypothetical protein
VGYPFVASNLANTPGAKTLIDQGYAAQVLGVGGYTFINDQLYLEVAGYQTLNSGALNSLGSIRSTPCRSMESRRISGPPSNNNGESILSKSALSDCWPTPFCRSPLQAQAPTGLPISA